MNTFGNRARRALGKPLLRKEDGRLLTGQGRFTDDFAFPGQAVMAVVRSTVPHATITGIDCAAAAAMPGVLGVFTSSDTDADGLGAIPHNPLPKTRYDLKLTGPDGGGVFIGPHHVLARDKVRFVGEAIAIAIAETRDQALDAAEAVRVAYDELPFVCDARKALSKSAPKIWNAASGNVVVDTEFGDRHATNAAFAEAAHIVEASFHIDRVAGVPMEPRSALAKFDPATGRYTLHAGGGGAVRHKHEIAEVLGIDPDDLQILCFDVGGNFGTRNRVYPEFPLAVWAAGKIDRPVKYTATRLESFLSDYQGRDLHTTVALALDRDGRFLALRADNVSNVGANCVSLSPLGKGSALVTGTYDIPVAHLRSRAVFTNTVPTQAYRSSGRPEVNFAIERLVEKSARELGFDPVDLRRRNLVRSEQMPYRNAVGARYDSGAYESNLDACLRLIGWDGHAARAEAVRQEGRLLGRGLGHYVESSTGSPHERAEFRVHAAGRIDVVIGTQPSGQGHETSFAQVAGDLLGVDVDAVRIVLGDTDIVSRGGGTHSGRSMRHAATVMTKGRDALVARASVIAAEIWDLSVDRIVFANGRFASPETNYSADWFELAALLASDGRDPADELHIVADNEMHDPVFPNGCAACEVAVDPATGEVELTRYVAVDDVGRCINPMIVHGQTHGGIAQGVGQALLEHCTIDPESGQPLAGSFMDYGMPRADTFPFFDSEIIEVLSPTNPLGIKAGGEGGTTPALAVIVNAVCHALRDFGVHDIKMPLTPCRVWQAIQDARSGPGKRR